LITAKTPFMTRSRKKGRQNKEQAPRWFALWHRLSNRWQHLIACACLVLIALAFFAPIQFSSKKLVGGDTVNWRSMAQSMITYGEQTSEQALWAVNAFGGMPGYMISYSPRVPQLDTLVGWIRLAMWPTSHLLLLFFGMYLLIWFLTSDKRAAVLASILYGLTTYLPELLMAGHNSKFVALAWAPWLLLAFVFVLKKPGLLSGLLFAVAAAIHLRAGHIQITYFLVFLIGIWWAGSGISAGRNGQFRSFALATGWLVLGAGLAILMFAQPLLAQLEYKQFTIRGAGIGGEERAGLGWAYAMGWSEGISELLTLLIANSFGGGGASYWGPKAFTAGPHYFGAIAIVLALWALFTRRSATTNSLGVAALLMILFSLGEYFPILNRLMFDHFPLFSSFRVPETWLSVVALTVSILAGMGLAELLKPGQTRTASGPGRSFYVVFGVVAAFILIPMLLPDTVLDFEKDNESGQIFGQIQSQYPDISASDPRVQRVVSDEMLSRRKERHSLFQSDARRSLLVLLLAFVLLYLAKKRRIPKWAAALGLIVIAALDLGGVGRRYINEDILSPGRDVQSQVRRFAFDDFILKKIEESGGPGHFRVLSLEDGRDPSTNARPSFFYESLGGYHGAKLRLYQDFLDQILIDPNTGALNPNALDIMNVRYVIGRRAIPGFRLVFQDDATGNGVFENPDVLPRAHFADRAEGVASSEAAFARLRSPDFDASGTVLLNPIPEESAMGAAPRDSIANTSVVLTSYSPGAIEFDVATDARRWLVISEVYYPAGWSAYIDGNLVEIRQADYLLRAVDVPAGEHKIRMVFDPVSDRIGYLISMVATLLVYGLLAVLLILSWLRRRRNVVFTDQTNP
jgi:Bacterial membrane protein YfhO